MFGKGIVELANKPAAKTYLNYAEPGDITTAVANLVDSSPTTLDTLDELAAALGDDPNYATTVATALGNRVKTDGSSTMTGALAMGTNKVTGLGEPTLSTDASTKNYVDNHTTNGNYAPNPATAGTAQANKALVVNGNTDIMAINKITAASYQMGATTILADGDEINFLQGVTSAVQTQVDAKLPLAGGTMSGNIAMGSQDISGCGGVYNTTTGDGIFFEASEAGPAGPAMEMKSTSDIIAIAGWGQGRFSSILELDQSTGNMIYRSDGYPNAYFNMSNFKIENLKNPTNAQDGATKNYCDTTFLHNTGGSISGSLSITDGNSDCIIQRNENNVLVSNGTDTFLYRGIYDAGQQAFVESTGNTAILQTPDTASGAEIRVWGDTIELNAVDVKMRTKSVANATATKVTPVYYTFARNGTAGTKSVAHNLTIANIFQ